MRINKGRIAAAVLGIGGGGGLKKLTINYQTRPGGSYDGEITVLFNPAELRYDRMVNWSEQQIVYQSAKYGVAYQWFESVEPETLSLSLFLDTYESHKEATAAARLRAALPAQQLFSGPAATSVKRYIDELAALATINQELHRPPYCRLHWGKLDVFWGVLTSFSYTYTMFMPDGMPVRATAECSFVEASSISYAARSNERHSADVAKTRTVRRNETLQSIAAEEYDDPGLWRHIARANGIVNPRALTPGQVLKIPRLRP